MERDTLDIEELFTEDGVLDGLKVRLNDRGHITLIDKEDLHFVQDYKWRWLNKNKHYVVRGKRIKGKYRMLYLHREIMLWHGWHIPKGAQVDHENQNKYDNRKQNLRVVTPSQNNANRRKESNRKANDKRKRKNNSYKGVTLNKRTGAYEARIQFEGKYMFLGSFPNAKMAAYYYNEAAKQIHGKYAELNYLGGD